MGKLFVQQWGEGTMPRGRNSAAHAEAGVGGKQRTAFSGRTSGAVRHSQYKFRLLKETGPRSGDSRPGARPRSGLEAEAVPWAEVQHPELCSPFGQGAFAETIL